MEGRRTVFNKQKLKTLVSAPRELETFHMPIYLPPWLNTAAKNQLAREAPAYCVANTSPSTLDGTSVTLAVQGVSLQGRIAGCTAIFKNYMCIHDVCGERKGKWFMAPQRRSEDDFVRTLFPFRLDVVSWVIHFIS